MIKVMFVVIFSILFVVVYLEIKLYNKNETKRRKKLAELTAAKDNLGDERLRGSKLNIQSETALQKAENDDLQNEINSLEEDSK